jgi:hypothetical protein
MTCLSFEHYHVNAINGTEDLQAELGAIKFSLGKDILDKVKNRVRKVVVLDHVRKILYMFQRGIPNSIFSIFPIDVIFSSKGRKNFRVSSITVAGLSVTIVFVK